MSSNTGKERARRYRQKLAADGGRTLAFYIDGANDARLKELMAEHGMGQGDALKFAIHLAHAATFATEDTATEATTDEQPATKDTRQPKQGTLPGVTSQATQATKDNTKDSNGTAATDERPTEPKPIPEPTPPQGPTLEQIAEATTWSGVPWAQGSKATLPKKMLAQWLEHRRGDGWTLREMCAALNEAGIPTAKGLQWKHGGLHTFMSRYCK